MNISSLKEWRNIRCFLLENLIHLHNICITVYRFRSCLKMVPAFYYAEFSRQFRLWKRERSSSYVTDDKDENGRKGRVRKKRNYF